MTEKIIKLIIFVALAASSLAAKAQDLSPTVKTAGVDSVWQNKIVADSSVIVSLLTAGPGREIYELEGHTGLRMQYDGQDVVANWGLFDFNSPNFVWRFVKGETDYCVGIWPFGHFIAEYRAQGRWVFEQRLNLDKEQALKLIEMVNEAAKPENRTYRYNYVLDNCATRPLRYIEQAIAPDQLDISTYHRDADFTPYSFRGWMTFFHRNYPWYQFGIDLALGSGIDHEVSAKEGCFAPVNLMNEVSHASINDSIPLVVDCGYIVGSPDDDPTLPPTPWYLTPLTLMWVLCGVCLAVAVTANRQHRVKKGFEATFFTAIGLMGCVIAFLVFVSTHEATAPNWIILWMNPLCFLVPALIYFPSMQRILRYYMYVNIFLLAVYAMVGIFDIQYINSAIIPIVLADFIMSISYLKLSREPNL